jgi:hypothetical protein
VTVIQAGLSAAGDDQQKAAPLGLFVLLLLGVACYFLFKSMSRHLKRVRDEFPLGSNVQTTPTTRPMTPPRSVPTAPAADDVSRAANQGPDGADDEEHTRPS